ncbi:unnamed protein product [Rhizoctonia solani]|uniref:Uncharacterized protein n=1 Tax=Rhizoctonia solani TaxID=456999 RepID=A0A8H3H321_9AGAM|nr:unnamed protein product [Rhizoctonia solani]
MSLTLDSSLGASNAVLTGLPGSLSPIKARTVYIQSGLDNETEFHRAWRLEVEMLHNWYEAYVAIAEPATIIAAIDWASDWVGDDSRSLGETKLKPARTSKPDTSPQYKVWKFGINDPSWG